MRSLRRSVSLVDLGVQEYRRVLALQRVLQRGVACGLEPETVLFVEHPSVYSYTLGRGSSESNLLFDASAPPHPLERTERGGEVTFHSPGQLVVYPILDLSRSKRDLHWYLRQVEETALRCLALFRVQGNRVAGRSGVFIGDRKICFCGIHVHRWVTMHGLSLNVSNDLDGFGRIVPCGLKDLSVCRLRDFVDGATVEEVKPFMRQSLESVFGVSLEPAAAPQMDF